VAIEKRDDQRNDAFAQEERQFLTLLAQAGYEPRVIYDIGAAVGGWAETICSVCPNAGFHLFEPLADALPLYRAGLAERLARYPNLTLHKVAISDSNGKATMSVANDAWSSTLVNMGHHADFGIKVTVAQHRLDDYIAAQNLPWPDLIKMDTQATEHLVIAGGKRALGHAEIVMAECWLYREYGPKTPLLTDLVALLEPRGFQLCELGAHFYDDSHRLYGVDAVFAKRAFLKCFAPVLPKASWSAPGHRA
jgi:FkbM family methyltransferase